MYYQLIKNKEIADVYIYGDIVSSKWKDSDVTGYSLVKDLQGLQDAEQINVYISSYGGSVKEGLAIYNALKRHPAKVITHVDGFACSIASVIFCAGDVREMDETSLLMIHNAWTLAVGDSDDLKKQAEDLDKITNASRKAYLSVTNLNEEEIKELMDQETWIDADEALEMGFITKIVKAPKSEQFTQSARKSLMKKILGDKTENTQFMEKYIKELFEKHLEEQKEEKKTWSVEHDETGEPEEKKNLGKLFLSLFK